MSTKYGGAIVDLIEKGLPNVVDVIEVSCKNSTNIPRLRDLIYDTVMNLKADGKHGMDYKTLSSGNCLTLACWPNMKWVLFAEFFISLFVTPLY